jgi:hypothetical protein
MRFKFTIKETLTKEVVVEAPSAEEAEERLEEEWAKSDKFMPPEECMSDIDFILKGETNEQPDFKYKPVFKLL